MKELICICCPRGCRLCVDEQENYRVMGNSCPRGEEYGRNECIAPVRVVTSTVILRGGSHPRCPVKTEKPVPKGDIFRVMKALEGVCLQAPVHLGQVILKDICGTDIIATREIPADSSESARDNRNP